MNSIFDPPSVIAQNTRRRVANSSLSVIMPNQKTPKREIELFRESLEGALGGFRQAVVGIAGVLGKEKTNSLAKVLAQSVAMTESMTTTVAQVTRSDLIEIQDGSDESSWEKIQLKKNRFNAWPNKPVVEGTRYHFNSMELLRWLRRESDFSLVTFDTLGEVLERVPLARRLDGLIIVNSGKEFDVDVMNTATRALSEKGVRVMGQVRSMSADG
ncbi:MAG: hypothetical protein KTR32_42370 [Granulosicoccus sp.]|nr:hypothetical protein [Granulosicoccus sp.]